MRDFNAAREDVYDAFAPEPTTPQARAYAASTGRRHIPGVSIGKGRAKPEGAFRLALFTEDAALAEKISAKVAGEADVYLRGLAEPQVTANFTKRAHRVKFIGNQVMPDHQRWVGTGSLFVPMADDPTTPIQITNRHVTGFGMRRGDLMRQGGKRYAWHVAHSNFSTSVPIRHDCSGNALDAGLTYEPWKDRALDDDIAGIRAIRDSDLQREMVHTGQTIGSRKGRCIATDLDIHYINYGAEGVAELLGHCAFVADDGKPFSVGGHSGATIVSVRDRMAVALLDSGGPSGGQHITYADGDLPSAIRVAGGLPRLMSA